MNAVYAFLILLSAVPGVLWTLRAARGTGGERSRVAAVGIALLTLAATGFLLALLGYDTLL